MSPITYEPARSYDLGGYLWGQSFGLAGEDYNRVIVANPYANEETIRNGFMDIDAAFWAEDAPLDPYSFIPES